MTDRTYNIGSGQTYATIAAAASTAQSETTGSDTAIFLLHDSTFVGTTLLNFAAGATVIVRANTPFDGKFGGGSKIITTQLYWANSSAGACTFRMEGLWADGGDWGGFTTAFAFSVGGAADQTLQFVNCGARNPKANWRPFRWQAANVTRGQIATFENCVFNDVGPETIRVDASTGATQVINFKGCTFADSRFLFGRSASHSLTVNATGCIFDPDASNALITTSGSGGTLALNAEGCAFSEAQATVEALWVVDEACVFSIGMVTGTPTSGQIGFTDLDGDDLSLVADANNAAIGLAAGLSMPATDIEGKTRDGSPDAGAFESVSTPTVEPDAPTDLTVEALTTTSVQLSWTDNASNEQNFKVEYRTQGSTGAWTTASSAIVANATGYTVTGLATGSYEFRVAATNVVGSSSYATATGSTRLFKTGVSKGVGVNLERLNYYSPETPFYDIWRMTGEWQDINNDNSVARAPADVDVNNNPLSITGDKLRKYIRLNEGSTTQVWVLLYDGSGTFSLGNVSNQVATSGRIEFTMNSGNVWLDITSIGTLSNFRVFRIEDESLYATNIFRQDFLDTWSAVRCFRYLNWGSDGTISDGSRADCVFSGSGSATITKAAHGLRAGYRVWFLTVPTGGELTAATYYYVVNATTDTFGVAATKGGTAITVAASSGLTHSLFFVVRSSLWADRPTLSTSGMKYNEVPLEIIIAHSNATGKDCWVQVPYVVDDEFVENMAILFRDGITGNQKIYVEYSNECWNFSFPQASYCKNQAAVSADPFVAAVYGANEYHGGYVWFGMRTKEVMDIWTTVFAGEEDRLVRVLSWQAADSSAAADAMSYPGIIDSIDAVAIGPYAGGGIGATGAFGSTAVGDIIDLLIADIADTVQTWAPAYVTAWRDDYGLRILGYEGGTHLYATTGDSAESDKFADVNRDAGIYQFVQDYLTAWHAESDDLLCWYKTTSEYGQYGYWGLRESEEQTRNDSYKMDSFLDYIKANTASSSSGRRRYLRLGLGLR